MRRISILLTIALLFLLLSCAFSVKDEEITTLAYRLSTDVNTFLLSDNEIIVVDVITNRALKESDDVRFTLMSREKDYTPLLTHTLASCNIVIRELGTLGEYTLTISVGELSTSYSFTIDANENIDDVLVYSFGDAKNVKIEGYDIKGFDEYDERGVIIESDDDRMALGESINIFPNDYRFLYITYKNEEKRASFGTLKVLNEDDVSLGDNLSYYNDGLMIRLPSNTDEKTIDLSIGTDTRHKKSVKLLVGKGETQKTITDPQSGAFTNHSKSGIYFDIIGDKVTTSYAPIYNGNSLDIKIYRLPLKGETANFDDVEPLDVINEGDYGLSSKDERNKALMLLASSNTFETTPNTREEGAYEAYLAPIEYGYRVYLPYDGIYRVSAEVISANSQRSSGVIYIGENGKASKTPQSFKIVTKDASPYVTESFDLTYSNFDIEMLKKRLLSLNINPQGENPITTYYPHYHKDMRPFHTLFIKAPETGYFKYYEYYEKNDNKNTSIYSYKIDDETSLDESLEFDISDSKRVHHITQDVNYSYRFIGDTTVLVLSENQGGGYGNVYDVNEYFSDDQSSFYKNTIKIRNRDSYRSSLQSSGVGDITEFDIKDGKAIKKGFSLEFNALLNLNKNGEKVFLSPTLVKSDNRNIIEYLETDYLMINGNELRPHFASWYDLTDFVKRLDDVPTLSFKTNLDAIITDDIYFLIYIISDKNEEDIAFLLPYEEVEIDVSDALQDTYNMRKAIISNQNGYEIYYSINNSERKYLGNDTYLTLYNSSDLPTTLEVYWIKNNKEYQKIADFSIKRFIPYQSDNINGNIDIKHDHSTSFCCWWYHNYNFWTNAWIKYGIKGAVIKIGDGKEKNGEYIAKGSSKHAIPLEYTTIVWSRRNHGYYGAWNEGGRRGIPISVKAYGYLDAYNLFYTDTMKPSSGDGNSWNSIYSSNNLPLWNEF